MLCQESQRLLKAGVLAPQDIAPGGFLRGAKMEPPSLNQQEVLGIRRQKEESIIWAVTHPANALRLSVPDPFWEGTVGTEGTTLTPQVSGEPALGATLLGAKAS